MGWLTGSWKPWFGGGVLAPLAVLGILVVAGADPLPTRIRACEAHSPLDCVTDGPVAALGFALTAAIWLVGAAAVLVAWRRWRLRDRLGVLASEEQAAIDRFRLRYPRRVQLHVRAGRATRLGTGTAREPDAGDLPALDQLVADDLALEVIPAAPAPPRFDPGQRRLHEPAWPPGTPLVIRAGTPLRWYGADPRLPCVPIDGPAPAGERRWAVEVPDDVELWIAGELREDGAGFRGVDHALDPADGVVRVDGHAIEHRYKPGWEPPDLRRWEWPVGLWFPFLGPWLSAAPVLLAPAAWAVSPLVGLPLTTLLALYVRHLCGRIPEDVSRRSAA